MRCRCGRRCSGRTSAHPRRRGPPSSVSGCRRCRRPPAPHAASARGSPWPTSRRCRPARRRRDWPHGLPQSRPPAGAFARRSSATRTPLCRWCTTASGDSAPRRSSAPRFGMRPSRCRRRRHRRTVCRGCCRFLAALNVPKRELPWQSPQFTPQVKSLPPSTLMLAPVIYELRRDARNATTRPISSGRPARGMCAGWPKCLSMAAISA